MSCWLAFIGGMLFMAAILFAWGVIGSRNDEEWHP